MTTQSRPEVDPAAILEYFRGGNGLVEYARSVADARQTGIYALMGFGGNPEGLPHVLLLSTREACVSKMMHAGQAWSHGGGSMCIEEGPMAISTAKSFLRAARDQTAQLLGEGDLGKLNEILESWEQ